MTDTTVDAEKNLLDALYEAPAEADKVTPRPKPDDSDKESEETDLHDEEVDADDVDDDAGEPDEDDEDQEELDSDDNDEDYDDEDQDEDEPETLYNVKVNGREEKVTLDELRRAYSGQKYIQQGMEEAAKLKTEAQQQHSEAMQKLQVLNFKLQEAERLLSENQEQEVDLDELYRTDPVEWSRQSELRRQREERRQKLAQERQRAEQVQMFEQQRVQAEYLKGEMQKLVEAVPEFGDTEKVPSIKKDLLNTAKEFGFSPQEVESVADHRALRLLYELAKVRKAAKPIKDENKVKPKKRRQVLRPGSPRAARKSERDRKKEEIRNRAQESGKIEDIALTLLE